MNGNIIKGNIEKANILHIKDRNLLSLKNKLIYQLFDKDRPENSITIGEYDHASRKVVESGSKHKILMLVSNKNNAPYLKFGYPYPNQSDDELSYIELSIDSLKTYSKTQLILLYEGWLCFDGIDIALFHDLVNHYVLNLPYKTTKVSDYY